MSTPSSSRKPAVFRINKKQPVADPIQDNQPQNYDSAEAQDATSHQAVDHAQDLSGSLHVDNATLNAPTHNNERANDRAENTGAEAPNTAAQSPKKSRRPTVVKADRLAETPFPTEPSPHIDDDGSDDYMHNDWEQNHTITAAAIPSLNEIKRGLRWGNILFSAVSMLIGLIVLGWITSYISELYQKHSILGYISLAVVAVIGLALLALLIKEIWSVRRLRNMHKLRIDAELAIEKNDSALAKECVAGLEKVLGGRKDLKWAFDRMKEHEGDIRDGREIITLTERELMKPLDIQARNIVARSARRVSVVTAISPFAFLDMGFVAYENLSMLRRINLLYGGKPGTFSTFRIIGMVVGHLAVAGGAALAEDMMKHVLTHSMAAKLSAKLGQGLLNGGLTARIGIVATTLMRPLPYIERKPPNFKAMVKEVFRTGK